MVLIDKDGDGLIDGYAPAQPGFPQQYPPGYGQPGIQPGMQPGMQPPQYPP